MKKTFALLAVAVLVFSSACAQKPGTKPAHRMAWLAGLQKIMPKKKTPPPAAMPVDWAGTIRMVNVAENFALVESHTSTPVVPGEKYLSVQNGRETGALLVTALKAHPFLIADIVDGNPAAGDKIYIPRPAWPTGPSTAGHVSSSNTPTTEAGREN